jgi:hypothetical protein
MSNYKGSKAVVWKFLDGLPKHEVAAGMDLSGIDKQWGGSTSVDGECIDIQGDWVTRLHPATWEKYYRYGWITKARTLSKKGLKAYLSLKKTESVQPR